MNGTAAPGPTAGPLAVLLVALAAYDVARSTVLPDGAHTVSNVAMITVVALVAVAAHLTAREIGLARADMGAGLSWGLQAFAAITLFLAIAASVPALQGIVDDDRVDVSAPEMVWRALVVIPVGTVVLEELAFRGLLLALLRRLTSDPRAIVTGSVLFGVWHVPGVAGDGAPTIVVTVVATTIAGLVLTWLRLGSGSLLAPALAHVATNAVTFVLAWAIARG